MLAECRSATDRQVRSLDVVEDVVEVEPFVVNRSVDLSDFSAVRHLCRGLIGPKAAHDTNSCPMTLSTPTSSDNGGQLERT